MQPSQRTFVSDIKNAALSGAIGLPAPMLVGIDDNQPPIIVAATDTTIFPIVFEKEKPFVWYRGPIFGAKADSFTGSSGETNVHIKGPKNTYNLYFVVHSSWPTSSLLYTEKLIEFINSADPSSSEDPIIKFLSKSYGAWESGKLSQVSPWYEKKAHKHSVGTLVSLVMYDQKVLGLLSRVIREPAFDDDEIMLLAGADEGVVTTKRYYMVSESRDLDIIDLRDITSYDVSGWWTGIERISTTSGRHIEREVTVYEKYMNNLLKHLDLF